MNKNPHNTQSNPKSRLKSADPKPFCRGFSSIDQEMAREIAMQWFSSPVERPIKFHGYTLSSKK